MSIGDVPWNSTCDTMYLYIPDPTGPWDPLPLDSYPAWHGSPRIASTRGAIYDLPPAFVPQSLG